MTTTEHPIAGAARDALAAAVKLHDFIRGNAGETDEWPLRITSTEAGALEKLDNLLREFRTAHESFHKLT